MIVQPEYNTKRLDAFTPGTSMTFNPVKDAVVDIVVEDKMMMKWLVTDAIPQTVVEITMYDCNMETGEVLDELSQYKERYELVDNGNGTTTLNIYGGIYYRLEWEKTYTEHETMWDTAIQKMKAISF